MKNNIQYYCDVKFEQIIIRFKYKSMKYQGHLKIVVRKLNFQLNLDSHLGF